MLFPISNGTILYLETSYCTIKNIAKTVCHYLLKKGELYWQFFLQKIIFNCYRKNICQTEKLHLIVNMELQIKFFLCISFYENS